MFTPTRVGCACVGDGLIWGYMTEVFLKTTANKAGYIDFTVLDEPENPVVFTGGLMLNGERVEMTQEGDGRLCFAPLSNGTWLLEVRANGATVVYGKLHVLPSPIGAPPGNDSWTFTLDAAQELALVSVTLNQGPQGPQGETGATGASAYELAVMHGYEGTEAEWVAELEGAQEAATAAKASETTAANSASAAANSAAAAAGSATAAGNSATAAAGSATTAAEQAAAAKNSATAAGNSATTAAGSATTATEQATAAESSATAAGNSATAAARSAATATEQAGAAANSAAGAANSATAAAGSAKAAATSAAQCETLAEAVVTHEARTDIHLMPEEKDALARRGLLNGEVIPDAYFADWVVNRPETEYGVLYYDSRSNPASAVTAVEAKTRDNAGLAYTPATDTDEGEDGYADKPEWAWRYCNFTVSDSGDPYPIALEGQSGFNLYDGDVGIIMRAFECADFPVLDTWDEAAGCYTMRELVISFAMRGGDYTAFRDCRRADNSVAPYVIIPAFHLGYAEDGKLYSRAGLVPAMMSHNQLITDLAARGGGWGIYYGRSSHWQFGTIIGLVKGGTKNFQALCKGNTSNWVQVYAAVERDTEETWFPLSVADAAKVDIGCAYSVGYGAVKGTVDAPELNIDRSVASVHAYGRQLRCMGKEEVLAADGTTVEYVKILLDTEVGYPTMPVDLDAANPGVWVAQVMLSSMPSLNGETLGVLGRHDGSLVSNTNSRHSYRIQGAEYGIGAWIVVGDMVLECSAATAEDGTALYPKLVWHCPADVTRSSSDAVIKATYTPMGSMPAKAGDYVVGDIALDFATGCWWPTQAVSGSNGWQDYVYNGGTSTSGTREFLTGGYLRVGSSGGPAHVLAGDGLGGRDWYFAARG